LRPFHTFRPVPTLVGPCHQPRPAPRMDRSQPKRPLWRSRCDVGSPAGAVVTSLRHVLLLVQSAVCGLVALGASVFAMASHSPLLGLLAAVSGMLALVPVLVAVGLGAGWGWAGGLGLGWELVVWVGGVAHALARVSGGELRE